MRRFLLTITCFSAHIYYCQGIDTQTRDDAGAWGAAVKSGFYQTVNPVNFPAGATSWWHLLDVRHTNPANNYAMQFAGSFGDQELFFRKTSNVAEKEWSRILTESPVGMVRIGKNDNVSSNATLRIFKSDISTIELANNLGRFEIAKVHCSNCAASGAKVGDAVIRNLGQSNNLILSLPNDNNDGASYIGFSDDKNGMWAKILNNKTARFDGKIYANEIEVKTNVWADFVFEKNYPLPALEQVENHIAAHGHLENIPSAAQAVAEGVNIGEFQIKLLQKIEELTLYLIEQNKRLQSQQHDLNSQKQQIEQLEQQLGDRKGTQL